MMSGQVSEDVVPSPGGDSVVSSKRGASPDGAVGGASGLGDDAARKKKKTAAASRGVANLTPEQLAKKRENDREAQRNIRRRTKEQIESLERQILELTSQQPYQDYLAMKRAKEAVEKENSEIKQRLATIIGDVQALVGPTETSAASTRGDYASPAQSYYSAPNSALPPAAPSVGTPASAGSPASLEMANSHHSWQAGGSPGQQNGQAKAQLNQQRREMKHGLDMGPERLGLGFLLDPNQHVAKIQTGANGAQDTSRYHHTPMKHDWTDVRNDQALRARPSGGSTTHGWEPSRSDGTRAPQTQRDGNPSVAHRPSAASPGRHHEISAANPSLSRHAIPIRNCDASCPLDSLLLDFLHERRQRLAEGLSTHEAVGPRYPSVSSLLNPSHSVLSHPLSKVFTDILSTFPDISTLPERVAVLYIMFLVMRWQISPTQENYERLPEWMRPSDAQLYHAHPAWIDHLPFPRMRDKLAREPSVAAPVHASTPGSTTSSTNNGPDVVFDDFFIPFTTTLSLSWPYEETDTLLQSPDSDELLINPVFERHLRNQKNWTLGEPFAKAFPQLVDLCNINWNNKGVKSKVR